MFHVHIIDQNVQKAASIACNFLPRFITRQYVPIFAQYNTRTRRTFVLETEMVKKKTQDEYCLHNLVSSLASGRKLYAFTSSTNSNHTMTYITSL